MYNGGSNGAKTQLASRASMATSAQAGARERNAVAAARGVAEPFTCRPNGRTVYGRLSERSNGQTVPIRKTPGM